MPEGIAAPAAAVARDVTALGTIKLASAGGGGAELSHLRKYLIGARVLRGGSGKFKKYEMLSKSVKTSDESRRDALQVRESRKIGFPFYPARGQRKASGWEEEGYSESLP